MSCPDWFRLLEQREAGGDDPAGWESALRHLAQCGTCRETVLRLEPAVVFTALPELDLPADEGRRMVAVVRSLRRGAERSRSRRAAFLRLAAAVVLVAGALVLMPERQADRGRVATVSPAARGGGFSRVLPAQQAGSALLALDSPGARVYEMETPDMAVVMVVDDALDLGVEP